MPGTKGAVQPQKMDIGLKFKAEKVEGFYYPCSKSKCTDHLHKTAPLICGFIFTYAKIGFLMTQLKWCLFLLDLNNLYEYGKQTVSNSERFCTPIKLMPLLVAPEILGASLWKNGAI